MKGSFSKKKKKKEKETQTYKKKKKKKKKQKINKMKEKNKKKKKKKIKSPNLIKSVLGSKESVTLELRIVSKSLKREAAEKLCITTNI